MRGSLVAYELHYCVVIIKILFPEVLIEWNDERDFNKISLL